MIKIIKNEIFYQIKSGYLLIIIIVITSLSLLVAYSQVNKVNNKFNEIVEIKKMYNQNGEDFDKELERDVNVHMNNDGDETIDNLAKYSVNNYYASLIALNFKNSINQYFSSYMFIILPLILSILAIVVAIYDFNHEMFNLKLLKVKKWKLHLSKVVSIYLLSIISILYGWISYAVFVVFLKKIYINEGITLSELGIKALGSDVLQSISFMDKAIIQLLFIVVSIFIYVLFFYSISVLTKSKVFSISLLFIYMFLLPSLGKYDIKNQMLNIYPKIFNTNASIFHVVPSKDITIYNVLVTIIVIILISVTALYFSNSDIYNRRFKNNI